ncbi:hypothetical protein [Novosphingobium rosa]|uniref:hypothetical protein n=1 Tax=Novosphingobium rosa TaxID=76978 RepID=UPI000836195B|nr:hypothetical protein [Novosphingobium rosa]
MLLSALVLLMQAAPPIPQDAIKAQMGACGFPKAQVEEAYDSFAVTLNPATPPSDQQLECAAKLMVADKLWPGDNPPALAQQLRRFLLPAMLNAGEDTRQQMIERDQLAPQITRLEAVRDDAPALARQLSEFCGPSSKPMLKLVTPPGAARPSLALGRIANHGQNAAETDKAFLCLLKFSSAADLHIGFVGDEGPARDPAPAPLPSGPKPR